jgi:hypothetical protein
VKRALILALCVLSLAACGKSVTSGTVVGKEYVAARDWNERVPTYASVPITQTTCSTVNKQTSCRTSTTMEYRIVGWHNEARHSDQRWEVRLRDKDGNEGTVQVDQATYERLENGSQYSAPEESQGS